MISADGMTILLVGSDARTDADGNPLSAEELAQVGTEDDGGGINTDTIMLVHVPQGGGKATAVSLPRDTWIGSKVINQVVGPYADGTEGQYDANKINSYYSTAKAYTEEHLVNQGVTDKAQIERESNEAGRTMLIRVVQAFTGMKIDHYAEVNLLGFYLLSNAIGGVPVCLNAAVNDPWSGANFPAGPQEVQGTAALAFVRQRHGLPDGDLDRVRRQQAFLSGAAEQDPVRRHADQSRPKLNDLVDAVDRSVIFDKGFSVLTFAEQITNLSSGNINFETLPTTGPEIVDRQGRAGHRSGADQGVLRGDRRRRRRRPRRPRRAATGRSGVDHGRRAGRHHRRRRHRIRRRTASPRPDSRWAALGVVAGTRSGNEQQTTEVHYPADGDGRRAAGDRPPSGVGELVRGRRGDRRPRPAGRRHRPEGALRTSLAGRGLLAAGRGRGAGSCGGCCAGGCQWRAAPAAVAAAPVQQLAKASVPCVN